MPLPPWLHDNFRIEGAGVDGIGKSEFVAVMKAQLDAFPDYTEKPTNLTETDGGEVVHFVAHVRGTWSYYSGSFFCKVEILKVRDNLRLQPSVVHSLNSS